VTHQLRAADYLLPETQILGARPGYETEMRLLPPNQKHIHIFLLL